MLADVEKILAELEMDGMGADTGPEGAVASRTVYRIRQALEKAKEPEAEKVTRCGNCMFAVNVRGADRKRCLCPSMPRHPVEPDWFCNFGKPKEKTWGADYT